MARGTGRSTLAGIAAEAGVSVSAVSKVLNGRTDVAAGTRARIAALLRRDGYQVASRLGFGVVDLLIATLHTPWAEELLRGTVQAADEAGASVVVSTVDSPGGFTAWLNRATARGTDGALTVLNLPDSSELQRLAAARIPLVVIDPPEEPGPGIRSVGTTNWQGCLTATRHLIELGHRRIAIIGGPEHLWSSRARLAGYRAALEAAGLAAAGRDAPGELIRRDHFCAEGGRRQARELLDSAAAADRHRGRQRRAGLRRAPGARRAGVAGPRGPQRGGVRRRPGRLVGHPRAHHRPPAPRGHGGDRVPDAAGPGHRPSGGFRDRGAAPHRAGHHPGDQGEHRAAGQGYINVIPDV